VNQGPLHPGHSDTPALLPARMLNEFVYCPRLFHLEWVQGEWAESADTVAGRFVHRRVDQETGELPSPEALANGDMDDSTAVARSLELSSEELGLIAKLDLAEAADGSVRPVDYKKGRAPEQGAWDADRIQVGAQALLLRAHGYRCNEAVLYYAASRTRVTVHVDERLEREVHAALAAARAVAASAHPPEPLIDSPKCPRCSLVGICLPDEVRALSSASASAETEVRRLSPARDDALPVYVQTQGAYVGKRGEELEFKDADGVRQRVRLLDISQLCLFGSVQVTAQAFAALFDRGIPVCHFSMGAWFHGISHGIGNRNADLRLHQYRTASDAAASLTIARGLVQRKLLNQRTLLRRNAEGVPPQALVELERLADRATRADDVAQLLGFEGLGARHYFEHFPRMLRAGAETSGFDFQGRNRRPPKDPINALLSLAYAILAKDFTVTLLAVGLDPFFGFLHRPRFGRAPLALDLMEEFRPLIADSVVLQLVNNGEVQASHFLSRGGAVSLTPEGRKKFFRAYERRMAHLVTHPIFGYRISYRRLLEVQARLLARHLCAELPEYPGFRTR